MSFVPISNYDSFDLYKVFKDHLLSASIISNSTPLGLRVLLIDDIIGSVERFGFTEIHKDFNIKIDLAVSPEFISSDDKLLDFCIKEYNFLQFLFDK